MMSNPEFVDSFVSPGFPGSNLFIDNDGDPILYGPSSFLAGEKFNKENENIMKSLIAYYNSTLRGLVSKVNEYFG